MTRVKILRNRAKCLICGDEIESRTVHEYKTCSCGNLSVDGGLEYTKRNVKDLEKWEDLSEYEEQENG